MSGCRLAPCDSALDRRHAADDAFWNERATLADNEVWRYARRLAADAQHARERARRGTRRAAANPPVQANRGESQAAPRRARAGASAVDAGRGLARTLLLVAVAAAGVASGMYVGGSGVLPLDLRPWRPLIAQVLQAGQIPSTAAATATTAPLQAGPGSTDLLATALIDRSVPAVPLPAIAPGGSGASAAPPTAVMPAPPAGAITRSQPPQSAAVPEMPAAALDRSAPLQPAPRPEVPAGAVTRSQPPQPVAKLAAVGRPAAPYRVQLALLRNPRNAEPVWRAFVSRVGPLAAGLERHVLPTRTARGLRHLVQAGPLADAGAAEALCTRVIAAGGDCLVVPPA